MPRSFVLAGLAAAWMVAGCGGNGGDAIAPIARESPEDQILRVGRVWESREDDQGFRSPPRNRISMFESRVTSSLTFRAGKRTASETLAFDERFKTDGGTTFKCRAGIATENTVVFGEHAGEAAVEIRRPALELTRTCDGAGFPEPLLELAPVTGRFGLRGDQLVGFAPTTEKRVYLPVQ